MSPGSHPCLGWIPSPGGCSSPACHIILLRQDYILQKSRDRAAQVCFQKHLMEAGCEYRSPSTAGKWFGGGDLKTRVSSESRVCEALGEEKILLFCPFTHPRATPSTLRAIYELLLLTEPASREESRGVETGGLWAARPDVLRDCSPRV